MNLKKITIAMLGAALLAGCASLEERLASSDPATKREAEVELISQSRRSPNQEDRIAAINRVTDQEILLVVATSAQGAYVPDGLAALAKLNGEDKFVSVVNSAQDAQVRKAAFDKINSQEVFEKLSVGASDPSIRAAAFGKINNQEVFEKLAVGASDPNVRAAAFNKLISQESILKVAKQSVDRAIMLAAIDKVADKLKLIPIVFESNTPDNAVVDAFVAKCKDKDVLLKMIAGYGEVLTTDQCAKIVSNNSSVELKSAVAKIADLKIYNEVLAYRENHSREETVEKCFEKVQTVSSGELKAKLVYKLYSYELGQKVSGLRECAALSEGCAALMKGLDAEGIVTILNLIYKEDDVSWRRDCAAYVINFFLTQAKVDVLACADKIDAHSLGCILSSLRGTKEAKEIFYKNPEWDSVDVYNAVNDSETAEYLLRHAKFNKLKSYSDRLRWRSEEVTVKEQLAEIVWHLVNQLDKNAREKMLKESVTHLNSAKKDRVIFEKFYIGMPVLDYLLITVTDGLTWPGDTIGLYTDRMCGRSILKGGDWRSSWTVSYFVFDQKERYRYFKTEGDLKGILAFVKKYCKRDIDVRDIQLATGSWWMFTDDAREMKISLHSENGALNIYSF